MAPTNIFIRRIRDETEEIIRQSHDLLRKTAPLLSIHKLSSHLVPGDDVPEKAATENKAPQSRKRRSRISKASRSPG
jgi:hypothetical protein